ncbi:MAG TPA: hypothetical protein VLL98_00415 [Rickettsiales bacterium]|nr:hypothetical protein [Rickettsiales bacterium]
MLRNLLYSLFFHLLFVTILIVSTFEFDKKILTTNITPLTINFLSENTIDDLKKVKTESENDKVKDLNLEEKIELYNKIKNKGDEVENIKVVYEKSSKKSLIKKTDNENTDGEENKFSYYYTPVYVLESKVNTEDKLKLIENRLKREGLRQKMKEKNIIPEINTSLMRQIKTLKDIVKISQKPLIIKKQEEKKAIEEKAEQILADNKIKETKEGTKPLNNEKTEQENNLDSNYLDELISEVNISNEKVDEKYKDINENEIFNKDDYNKLKEIEDNKIDSKYALSIREKVNIQRQIKGCYKMAILRSKKDSKAIIGLNVNVNKEGTIDMHNIKVNKIVDNFDNEGFAIALDNAKSALVFCSPLRGLPSGKYKTWKQMTFIFDSNNLE